MKQLGRALEVFLERACAVLMALMVLDVSWQVISRFVLGSPSSWSEELARFLLVWVGFLGAAYAYRRYAHLGLDLLTNSLEGRPRIWAERLGDLISLTFVVAVLIVGGIGIVLLTLDLDQKSAALGWPIGYIYAVIPLSGFFMAYFALERLVVGRSPVEETLPVD